MPFCLSCGSFGRPPFWFLCFHLSLCSPFGSRCLLYLPCCWLPQQRRTERERERERVCCAAFCWDKSNSSSVGGRFN
uniref:Putative secreted protein n=1 Tax=Anopheles marajoara TaxID=58244 RepID=A0A2M4CCE5_9DIPT